MRKWTLICVMACATVAMAGSDVPDPKITNVSQRQYVIGVDDLLAVSVWKEQELTKTLPVRPDGYITLPLIGDVMAKGRTSTALRIEIMQRLQQFMKDPVVTVSVQEIRSRKINVVGKIMKPGEFPLSESMTVIDAIALAGGFKDFAKESKIYVLRVSPDGRTTRMPFDYKHAIRGGEKTFALQAHDTIVVP